MLQGEAASECLLFLLKQAIIMYFANEGPDINKYYIMLLL